MHVVLFRDVCVCVCVCVFFVVRVPIDSANATTTAITAKQSCRSVACRGTAKKQTMMSVRRRTLENMTGSMREKSQSHGCIMCAPHRHEAGMRR